MRYIQTLALVLLLPVAAHAQTVAQGAPGSLPWKVNLFSASTIVPFPTALGANGGFKVEWAVALHVITDTGSTTAVTGTVTVTGPLTDTQLRATPVPISGTVTTGGLTDTQLRASAIPVSQTTLPALTAGSAVIGHVIADTGSTTAVTGNVAVTSAGLTNLDVALSTRTKPADQQHTIIDSSAALAVTGPLTDTQLRAAPVPVSGTVTATTGGLTDTQLRATPVPVSGTVVTGGLTDTQLRASPVPVSGTVTATGPLTDTQLRATPVPVSGAVTVTGSATANAGTNLNTSLLALEAGGNLATTATNTGTTATNVTTLTTTITNEQAIPGTTTIPSRLVLVGGQTPDSPAQIQPLPLTYNGGAVRVVATANAPLLPLQPCNPVRRINCQPKGF